MAFTRQPMQPGMLYDAAERVAADGPQPNDQDQIADMGWPLVLLPEDIGGLGGSLSDLVALVEGLAAHGSRLPVIERCAIAPLLLQSESKNKWVTGLANGSLRVAPLLGDAARELVRDSVRARRTADGFLLDGAIVGVDASRSPTHWVVIAELEAEGAGPCSAIFVLDDAQVPAPHSRHRSMDGRPTACYSFEGIGVAPDRCIAQGVEADAAIARAGQAALAMICADTVAVLGTLVELSVEYLNGRAQFGVALSTFQALRHQLVNVYIRYEAGRGMVTSFLSASGRDLAVDARQLALAKLALGEAARTSAETVIQLHGGMGMAEEMLAARLSQRLLANEFRFGDRFAHSAALTLCAGA